MLITAILSTCSSFQPELVRIVMLGSQAYNLPAKGAIISLVLDTNCLGNRIRSTFVILDISRHERLPWLNPSWLRIDILWLHVCGRGSVLFAGFLHQKQ